MRLVRSFPAFLLLPLLAAIPCGAQTPPRTYEGRDDVVSMQSGDASTDAAIARARATLPVFHAYLQGAPEDGVEVKLQARFQQGDAVEHMWLVHVTFDGREYRGVLQSPPMRLTSVSPGDEVLVCPERVSDWMVVVNGVMLGNFTWMEIRRRLSPKERTRMDRTMGYHILADTAITALPAQR